MFCLVFLLVLPLFSGALGISPAIKYVNFEPGLELEYSFTVFADPGSKIELFAEGEFKELVNFDKKELEEGGGSFTVKIKLPQQIERPGKHRIMVGARQVFANQGGIGTGIVIFAPIQIFVPYPGKYAEISLNYNNVNVGEPVNFKLSVSSMGKEDIFASASIEIYSNQDKIAVLPLGSKSVKSQTTEVFETSFDTNETKPGEYSAIAIVDYQAATAKAENKFKIGFLYVNITNYTSKIIKESIKPFRIDIESLWNTRIENVFAEIYIVRDNKNITDFLTPSISMNGFEQKTLSGYIDTEKLEADEYELLIKVRYVGEYTLHNGKLSVQRKIDKTLVFIVIIACSVFLALIIMIYIFYRKLNKMIKHGKKRR